MLKEVILNDYKARYKKIETALNYFFGTVPKNCHALSQSKSINF